MKKFPQPKDPRGGHIRLHWDMLDSPAWRGLTHADVRVYLAMRRKLGKTTNGDINAVLTDMAHAGITSSSTLNSALHRLEALGFIAKTRQGGIATGGKLCCLYRFTDECTYEIAKAGVKAGPATNEWKQFRTVAQAKAAVKEFAPKKKGASTIEAESFDYRSGEPVSNFDSRTRGPQQASTIEVCKSLQNQAETRMPIGFEAISSNEMTSASTSSTIEHLCSIAIPRVASAGMGHGSRHRWLAHDQADVLLSLVGRNQLLVAQEVGL